MTIVSALARETAWRFVRTLGTSVVDTRAGLDALGPHQNAVYLDGLLEVADDPGAMLGQAGASLATGGLVVAAVPTAWNLGAVSRAVAEGLGGRCARRYTRAELAAAVDAAGLDLVWLAVLRDPDLEWIPLPVAGPINVHGPGFTLPACTAVVVEEATAGAIVLLARRSQDPPACSIVVTTCGQPELLGRCLQALRDAPPVVPFELIVVDDGPAGGAEPTLPDGLPATVISGPRAGYAAAANAGIRAAQGDTVVLLHDDAAPRPGAIDLLLGHLRRLPETGLAGPRLVDPARGWVNGAGLALGPDLLPYPLYRFHPIDAPEVTRPQPVLAVSSAAMAVSRRLVVEAGGFDEALDAFEDGDLGLRLAARGHLSWYVPGAMVDHAGGGTPGDRFLLPSADYFGRKWADRLAADDVRRCAADGFDHRRVRSRTFYLPRRGRAVAPAGAPPAVLWSGMVFDRSGYANEARTFLLALQRAGVPAFANPYRWPPPRVELGAGRDALLDAMATAELPASFVHVCHLPAFTQQIHPAAVANVARTMWETDRLPDDRAEWCSIMDEVWVPKQQNVELFAAAGVARERLVIIPAAIDDTVYGTPGPPARIAGAEGFVFLSLFAWSRRKGWDALVQAYVEEFASHEDVTLVLAISASPSKPVLFAQQQFEALVRRQLGRAPSSCPRILWLPLENASPQEVAQIYRGANAYVMPTRGEGAALPISEAMASGLPVIVTRDCVSYVSDDTAFLVDYEWVDIEEWGWREFPAYRGHQWAEPSIPQLRAAMRRVIDEPDEAAARAERGRDHVLRTLSMAAVAEQIIGRLTELAGR